MAILTAKQRDYLKRKHKQERDKRICDRIKAVLAYDEGYSYTEVAEILLLDDKTIRRYVSDYLKKTKLKADHKGSRSKLDDEQSQQLVEHLLEHTYLYVKSICHYVELEFGVTYSVRGMTHWLHAQGFCYKKPHGVPAKADAQLQAEFKADYEELKTSLKPDEIICFADCSHPQHQTRLAYGWIKKGVRKAEKMTACQKRVNLIGAINLENHAVTHGVVDWVNAESIKSFLGQLSKVYSDKRVVHLIWDNAGYHKSKEIREFVKTTNIQLHYLPPYSPNLNPIERLWKIMHEQVTYNRYYEKFKDFTEAITGFFENIEQYSEIIRSRITDNFQRLTAA
jgi:transposase